MRADSDLRCPGCDEDALERFLQIADVPVVTTELWPSAGSARAAPRGDLDLAVCTRCGLIRNVAFDASRVDYTPSYESSQFFSPAFRDYADELAQHLIATYDLIGGVVAEIGSGKGEFLALLIERGAGQGFGYDPSYDGEVDEAAGGRLRFVREYFSAAHAEEPVDLVVCRHVLEHVEDPGALLTTLRDAIGERATPLYLEVPNAEFVLSAAGQWDLIYPHVSYFCAASLTSLLQRAGFVVDRVTTAFDDQFLCVEARPAPVHRFGEVHRGVHAGHETNDGAIAIAEQARTFGQEYDTNRRRWSRALEDERTSGRRVVLWGAGAKGVSFVNAVGSRDDVDLVVDVNERKQGGFVPGTAQLVVAPERLRDEPPGTVLIMNPIYEGEIRAHLQALGLEPDVVCV